MTQLNEIAEIHMGYTYRGSLKEATIGNTAIIQMRDASQEALLQPQNFARANLDHLSAHYFLQEGDLIFRARSLSNTAVLVDTAMPPTICVAPLMIIRITEKDLVLPAYLQWFINIPKTQKMINAFASDATIRMIPPAMMAGLELLLPSIARQQKIIATIALNQQIIAAEAQLAEKRQQYTQEALLQFAKGFSR